MAVEATIDIVVEGLDQIVNKPYLGVLAHFTLFYHHGRRRGSIKLQDWRVCVMNASLISEYIQNMQRTKRKLELLLKG